MDSIMFKLKFFLNLSTFLFKSNPFLIKFNWGCVCVVLSLCRMGALVCARVFPLPSSSYHPAVTRKSVASLNLAWERCCAQCY